MARIGVRSTLTLSDRFPEEVTGSFGPRAAVQKCRLKAAIDLLQRLLEITVSAYGKL